jgi:hypothetical protein
MLAGPEIFFLLDIGIYFWLYHELDFIFSI